MYSPTKPMLTIPMKATVAYVGCSLAAGAALLLGTEIAVPSLPEVNVGSVTASGLLAWLMWFMVAKQMPKQHKEHRDDMADARKDFLGEMEKTRTWANTIIDRQHQEDKATREELTKSIGALTDSIDSIQRIQK